MKAAPIKDSKVFGSFTDLFPPSLVKDLRQSFKNPLYISLLVLGLVYIALGTKLGMEYTGLMIALLALVVFILPMRAGFSVAADLREEGSNFMQLSPLSPWKIIWGYFLSALLQAFLLCVLLAPLCHHSLCVVSQEWVASLNPLANNDYYKPENHALIQSWGFTVVVMLGVLSFSALTSALMIVSAIVPVLLRVGLAGILMINACVIFTKNFCYDVRAISCMEELIHIGPLLLWGAWMLLLLAKRHYASATEVSSGCLRFVCLGCTVLYCAWFCAEPTAPYRWVMMLSIMSICLAALAIDELLPLFPVIQRRRKRCLLVKTCSSMSLLMMLLVVGLTVGSVYLGLSQVVPGLESFAQNNVLKDLGDLDVALFPQQASGVVFNYGLALMAAFYLPLWVTNVISKRSDRNRLVIYACCVLGVVMIFSLISIQVSFKESQMPYWAVLEYLKPLNKIGDLIYSNLEALQWGNYALMDALRDYVRDMYVLGAYAGGAALLALLFRRGR